MDDIDIAIILADTIEFSKFTQLLEEMNPCGSQCSIFSVPVSLVWNTRIRMINLYDILPPSLQAQSFPNDTNKLLGKYGKNKYRSLKKLLSAWELEYNGAIWVASETNAVQPFEIRPIFSERMLQPVVSKSRHGRRTNNWDLMRAAALILGHSVDSFRQQ